MGLFFALWLFFMQVCTGRSRHLPVCEVMVCILAVCWWIGAATTGASGEPWLVANCASGGCDRRLRGLLQLWYTRY